MSDWENEVGLLVEGRGVTLAVVDDVADGDVSPMTGRSFVSGQA